MNAIVIDTNLFRPCLARRAMHHREVPPSPDHGSCSGSASSSSPIHFKVETGSSKGSSDGETSSPTDFNRLNNPFAVDGQSGHSKLPVLAAL